MQEQVFNYLSTKDSEVKELPFIKESKGIQRKTRLDSYKLSFKNRTVECVENDFSVTGIFLASDDFNQYIYNYLKQNPSKTHYINEISRGLPSYIKNNKPKAAAKFILDLAQLEWAMIESFYNFFNYKEQKKQDVAPGETKIVHNHSLVLMQNKWPLDKIWNDEKAYEEELSYLSIWTTEDRMVHIRSWTSLELTVLQLLKTHNSLEQCIEKIPDTYATEDLTQIFEKSLPRWIELGLLSLETS